jgi:arylsulfatase A-like enzyme
MRPNIVLILIDDLGWRDLACTGSTFYKTPCLDRLARQGMTFTDAYAACPVCSPTRASLMTGQYPARVGITDWIDWGGKLHPLRGRLVEVPYLKQLPAGKATLAEALREGGYATWHVGKWHLGGPGALPQERGFEVNIGGGTSGAPGRYFAPWPVEALANEKAPAGTYLTDYLTDKAIGLVRQRDDRPFFLNFWHYAVHTPIQAKKDAIRRSQKRSKELGLDELKAIEEGEPFKTLNKLHLKVQRRRLQSDPVYAAMMANLDWNIGRLLKTLEDEGLADNTLVIFTSDNGGLATSEGSPTCNAPLSEGKGWMYDGGVRVPLLVRWPGRVAPGSACAEPVTSPDFFPTLLEAAGLAPKPHAHEDGVSFLPLLEGADKLARDAIFWHYPHYGNQGGSPGSSVRSGDYKLIEFFEDGRLELYNLAADIGETRNLAADLPEVTARLHGLLRAWREALEAKIPAPNPEWNPTP